MEASTFIISNDVLDLIQASFNPFVALFLQGASGLTSVRGFVCLQMRLRVVDSAKWQGEKTWNLSLNPSEHLAGLWLWEAEGGVNLIHDINSNLSHCLWKTPISQCKTNLIPLISINAKLNSSNCSGILQCLSFQLSCCLHHLGMNEKYALNAQIVEIHENVWNDWTDDFFVINAQWANWKQAIANAPCQAGWRK